MKTTISFVLVAFLILLGSAKSDFNSAVHLNGNPTLASKPSPVSITVPFALTGGNISESYVYWEIFHKRSV
jgi:hypothetical protein